MIHLDTSFLVDLMREARRAEEGPATLQLSEMEDDELWISVHSVCELFAGVEMSARPSKERAKVEVLVGQLQIAYPGEEFASVYGRLLADLTKRGQRIAVMDMLIATAALIDGAPLVTRNRKDFERVPGLEILAY